MTRLTILLTAVAALTFVVGLSGCKKTEPEGPSTATPAAETADGHEDHDHTDIEASLAKLTPEERASAEAQKVCPVSDHELGSMGAPVKVALGDKEVWICCEHCKEPLEKDQEKFLAKLEKKE